ncbi:cytochrome c family protein [Sphingomonas humi]|uniref:Cytochrome c domain-containing protein n=1 Tax=Sphingomonas humi TaxID=335630 RepID=A0ABP7RUI7_9SPHN
MNRSASLLASALLVGLSVTACGGGDKSSSSGGDTASTTATPATNIAEAAPATAAPAAAAAPAADNVDTVSGAKFADFTGDATKGEAVFVQCKTCHVTDAGVNRIGPSLHAIVGRHSGVEPGYTYSPANKNSGITWTAEKLFQYLENPQRVVPGTKMAFAGIQDPQKRADLIAWLATQK